MVELLAEGDLLMVPKYLFLINVNIMMKNMQYLLRVDHLYSRTVVKKYLEIYGDTILEETFGHLLKLIIIKHSMLV